MKWILQDIRNASWSIGTWVHEW